MPNGTMLPVHNNEVPVVTGAAPLSFVNFYSSTARGYRNETAVGTVSTNFQTSGYVTFVSGSSGTGGGGATPSARGVEISYVDEVFEATPFGDSYLVSPSTSQTMTDVFEATPYLSGAIEQSDFTPTDSMIIHTYQDYVVTDSMTVSITSSTVVHGTDISYVDSVFEATPFGDTYLDGYANATLLTDVFEATPYISGPIEFHPVDIVDSSILTIYQDVVGTDSLYLFITAVAQANVSLPPSNSSNPTAATFINNGSYVYQNSSTDPMSQPNAPNISTVSMVTFNFAVGSTTLCNCRSVNLNLVMEGGTFSVSSTVPIGLKGTIIHIAGIPCFIDKVGYRLNSGEASYKTSGFIGPNANLFKAAVWAGYGDSVLSNLIPTPALVIQPLSSAATARTVATHLAAAAGVGLTWSIQDVPITDFTPESGLTVIEAMKSAVARAGGELRFDGIQNYNVMYPDQTSIPFSIPSCKLVGPDGVETEQPWNIGTAPYLTPNQLAAFAKGYKNLPVQLSGGVTGTTCPPVQVIDTSTKVFTTSDPNKYVQLPVNYEAVYIQHLCHTDPSGLYCTLPKPQPVGDPSHVQGQVSSGQVLTGDWFLLNQPGSINSINMGGMQVPVAVLNSSCYPPAGTNADIDNGNFVTSIGVTLQPRANDNGNALSNLKDRESSSLLINTYRFVPVFTASLQTVFWGMLPIPGMVLGNSAYGTSTAWSSSLLDIPMSGGFTIGPNNDPNFPNQSPVSVYGKLRSVNLSLPGYMTMNFQQDRRILFNQPLANITARVA